MTKRNLRVLKWIGTTPAIATCTSCNQEFRVPLQSLKRVAEAQESLKSQFDKHRCEQAEGLTISEA